MRWRNVEQSGDTPGTRSSQGVTALAGGKLIMVGGERESRVPVDDRTLVLDVAEGTWRELAVTGAVPSPRIAPALAAIGDSVFLFGGRCGIEMGEGALADLYRLEVDTGVWHRLDTAALGQAPEARSFHAMAAAAGKLYVFGGCGAGGRLNDLHCYDPAVGSWEALPASEAVAVRGGACLVASPCGQRLLVIGGFCGKELGDVHSFHLGSATWECPACCGPPAEGDQLPPRSVFGAWVHGACTKQHQHSTGCGRVMAFGGEVDPSDVGHSGAGKFSADVFSMDPTTRAWSRLDLGPGAEARQGGGAPEPRGWFGSAASGGHLVVHGGLNVHNERLGDLWMLDSDGV